MRRDTLKRVAFGLALLLLVGSVPLQSRAAEPFEINAILPMTGPGAFLGKEQAQALNALEDSVNKAGGIDGRQIKFVVADDQSSPQTAVQLFNAVVAKKVAVVLGSSLVSLCNAMAPLAANGPVFYCYSPGMHPAEGSYAFSASIATPDLLLAAARYFKAKGWHKIAIITSNDATGQEAVRAIDTAFNAIGGATVVDRQYFNPTDASVAAQLSHIKASGAEAMIAWSTGTPVGTVFRSINDVGLEMPVLTTSGNATYAQMAAYAGFIPKQLYFSAPPVIAPEQLPNGPVKQAATNFLEAFKLISVRPDVGQALAWDPALLIIAAYRKLGLNASAAQVRDYIASVRGWAGIDGVYDFHAIPQRGIGSTYAVVARWDAAKNSWVAMSRLGGEPLR